MSELVITEVQNGYIVTVDGKMYVFTSPCALSGWIAIHYGGENE